MCNNKETDILKMEQKLKATCEVAQGMCGCISIFTHIFRFYSYFSVSHPGKPIHMLEYDSVQDLSLLLDSLSNSNVLRRLGQCLGVPPRILGHLQGFQDLCTSTSTLLPHWPRHLCSCPVLKLLLELLWTNDGVCCHGYKCNATFLTHIAPWHCYRSADTSLWGH